MGEWKEESLGNGVIVRRNSRTGRERFYAQICKDGRRYRRSAPTRRKAEALHARFVSEIEDCDLADKPWLPPRLSGRRGEALRREAAVPTLEAFAPLFKRDWAAGKRSERSIKNYVDQLLKDPKLAKARMDKIGVQDCQSYYAARKRKRSAATANRDLATLGSMFRRAAEWGLLPPGTVNPAAIVKKEREVNELTRFLCREQTEALLAASPDWFRLYLRVCLATGLRATDAANLDRRTSFDMANRLVRISGRATKGKAAVYVPMTADLLAVLEEAPVSPDTTRLLHKDGRPLTYPMIRRQWLKTRAAASREVPGLEGLRIHDLRHTFATYLRMSGCSVQDISYLLGHKDTRVTMRYAHMTRKAADRIVAGYDALVPPSLEEGARLIAGDFKAPAPEPRR